jgi:hypothetical protein
MDLGDLPTPLADRLGPEASGGLVHLFNDFELSLNEVPAAWSEQVLNRAGDRFERRLAEEASRLRVEMAEGFAGLRQEMSTLGSGLRQEMANHRVELLRWSFLFWIGQIAVISGLLAFMLRGIAR